MPQSRVGAVYVFLAGVVALIAVALAVAGTDAVGMSSAMAVGVVPHLAAAGALIWKARADRRLRDVWAALAAGVLLLAVVNSVDAVLATLAEPVPMEWVTVIGHLLFYPFVYVALVLMIRDRADRWYHSLILDGIVVSLLLGAFAATAIALLRDSPTTTNLDTLPLHVMVGQVAYPVGDIGLLLLIAGSVVLLRRAIDTQMLVFAAGVLCFALSDLVTLLALPDAEAVGDLWPDALSAVGIACLALSTMVPYTRHPMSRRGDGLAVGDPVRRSLMLVPVVASAAGLSLLLPIPQWRVPVVAQWLAVAALVVAGLRTLVTFREVWGLADQRRLARTDDLTGLPNRRALVASLESNLEAAQDWQGIPVALLLLDLDSFKAVNDTHGHPVGDLLLAAFALRLERVCQAPREQAMRMGGDEFAVVVSGAEDTDAADLAKRIESMLDQPFAIDGHVLPMTASIGIATAPRHGRDVAGLIRCADTAMYRAKVNGGGHIVYREDMGRRPAHSGAPHES